MTPNLIFGVIVLLLLVVGFATGGSITTAAYAATDGDNAVNGQGAPSIPQHVVPTDPRTWPSGDKIWDCCKAVAIAEGYNVAGSNPARLNNPGDLSDGASEYGYETHSGSNITQFPDANTGWAWLWVKLHNAATGRSQVYDGSMSWREIGAIWAPPNAETWARNVAGSLGVDPDSSLSDYVNG